MQTADHSAPPDGAPVRVNDGALRRMAWLLGLGGLIPFIGLAVLALGNDADLSRMAVDAQIHYAASILSFVGALHWGIALAAPAMGNGRTVVALLWSVVPSLWAWVATSAPNLVPDWDAAHSSLAMLAGGLLVAWIVDTRLYRGHPVPRWFPKLRATLTLGATVSVLVTMLA